MTSTPQSNQDMNRGHGPKEQSTDGEDLGDPDPYPTQWSEIEIIKVLHSIFKETEQIGGEVDFTDDCAGLIEPVQSAGLIITTDALCEGVHFDRAWDKLDEIGAQAAVVNLSDLASSGASPLALLWSLSIPRNLNLDEVKELALGFQNIATQYKAAVIGGNTMVRPGHLEIHVTAIGYRTGQWIKRSGASIGDQVFVTGFLGSRAIGYLDPNTESRQKRHQWRPHILESEILVKWGKVTAMMDISDGLLLDASRLAQCNQLTIHIDSDKLPLDPHLKSHPMIKRAALVGGEDYVLLFTAPKGVLPPAGSQAICIGECRQMNKGCDSWVFVDGLPHTDLGHIYYLGDTDR